MLGVSRAALLGTLTFARQAYGDMVMALKPVAYWHLSEATGTTIIDEKAVQNGTYEGTTQGTIEYGLDPIVENGVGTAIGFDGTHAYGQIPHNPAFELAGYTVDFAFQADTAPPAGQNRVLFTKDLANPAPAGALSIEIHNNNGQLKVRAYAGGAAGSPLWIGGSGGAANLQLGKAYKVAVTVDPSDGARLYLDGIQVAHEPAATVGWTANNTEPFVLGAYSVNGSAKFDGVMDEVVLFDRALSPNGVLRLAQATTIERAVPSAGTMLVPRRDVWLTNDDMAIPGTGMVRYATPGGSGTGGTSEGAAGDLQTTLSASSAGDTVVCLQGYYHVPSGLTFPSGSSATSPVTVMAKPGEWAVLVQDDRFLNLGLLDAGPGEGSSKTWTLHEAATNTWRIAYNGSSTFPALEGCWFQSGMAHMLLPYPDLASLMGDITSGGDKPRTHFDYWFSGTTVEGGFAYIRMERPNWYDMVNRNGGVPDATYGAWPDDGRYTIGIEGGGSPTWFSRSNSGDFKTGRPLLGQGLNPNNLRIYIAPTNTSRVLNNSSGNFTRMGSGMNSMGFKYYSTSRSNHELHRGCHYLPGYFIFPLNGNVSNVTAHRARMWSYGEHRLQGSMAVMKYDEFEPSGSTWQATHRNGLLSGQSSHSITNVTFDNCSLYDWHEVVVGSGTLNKVRFVNCTFHLIYDEWGQWNNEKLSQVEVGYCYFRDSSIFFGGSDSGTGGVQSPFCTEWQHHNIQDQRLPRSAWTTRTPMGGANSNGRGLTTQGAAKKYNNTLILNPDGPAFNAHALGFDMNTKRVDSPTNNHFYDEAFNNILILHDTKRYTGEEGGSNLRVDFIEEAALFKGSDSPNKHYRDYNLYYREVPVDPALGTLRFKKWHRLNGAYATPHPAYDYIRTNTGVEPGNTVFFGSSDYDYTVNQIGQPGGWESHGSDANPQIPSVSDFPASRMNYRPGNAGTVSAVATPPSGANWWTSPGWTSYGAVAVPFNMAPSTWKGALDPSGTTVPVGVQNP